MNDDSSAKDWMCDGTPEICNGVDDMQLHYSWIRFTMLASLHGTPVSFPWRGPRKLPMTETPLASYDGTPVSFLWRDPVSF